MNEPIALCSALVIGTTCLFSWLGFRSSSFEGKYIFDPEAVLAWKEYHRLFTSGFLHAGWWHLLWNMLSLYLMGSLIELSFGAGHFLLLYFGSIVGGNLLSLYIHRHHEYRAYGASGGVCGIIFAYLLLFPDARIFPFLLPFPIPGWLFAIGFMTGSLIGIKANNKGDIGHDAHLGGAIVGFLIAAALHPELARQNWKIFLIILAISVPVLIYIWINPMFLPSMSFFDRPLKKPSRSAEIPPHKREVLEIDTILEKISKSGIDSLSSEERTALNNASAKSRRRAETKKPESGLAI